jgi:CheY-like chemotaxis protein
MSSSRTVLLVDDEHLVRGVIAGWLRRSGYVVVEAGNGEEAWNELQRTQPDIVVSDLQMPGGSGWELVRRIRGTAALTALPVIIVTGSAVDPRRERLDCDLLLEKPFSPDQLLGAVTMVMDRCSASVSASTSRTSRRAAGG